jgi:hypothetical protein
VLFTGAKFLDLLGCRDEILAVVVVLLQTCSEGGRESE